MSRETRLKRLRFRAWHRGTKEADLLIGGFFDEFSAGWDESEVDWYERLLDVDDVTVMAWAIGREGPPENFRGAMMERMQRLDYIPVAK